jgi:hypothetical protein
LRNKYVVEIAEDERRTLKALISRGSAPARKLNRARNHLKADQGEHLEEAPQLSDSDIARMLETCSATDEGALVEAIGHRAFEGGVTPLHKEPLAHPSDGGRG